MARPEGTVSFWLGRDQGDWWSDDKGYSFPEIHAEGVRVAATKHPDGTIELAFTQPTHDVLVFRHPVPPCGPRGLMVAITWTPKDIILYLNGEAIETRPANA